MHRYQFHFLGYKWSLLIPFRDSRWARRTRELEHLQKTPTTRRLSRMHATGDFRSRSCVLHAQPTSFPKSSLFLPRKKTLGTRLSLNRQIQTADWQSAVWICRTPCNNSTQLYQVSVSKDGRSWDTHAVAHTNKYWQERMKFCPLLILTFAGHKSIWIFDSKSYRLRFFRFQIQSCRNPDFSNLHEKQIN